MSKDTRVRATTTAENILRSDPCERGLQAFLAAHGSLAADDPISLIAILESKSNPVEDVIWALRAVREDISKAVDKIARDISLDYNSLWPIGPRSTYISAMEATRRAAAKGNVGHCRKDLEAILRKHLKP